jgi:site-specific DNA recombinase
VGYFRASTDETNQPYTLEMQEEKVRAYCHSQDGMELTAVYEERASGKNIEGRPRFLQLLEDAAAGKFDAVVVYKVDRWSRQLADMLSTVDFLDRHTVRFASVTEPIDTSTPMGRMVLQMLGSFAEFERGLIVERVIAGIEAKLAKGLPLTSRVGFGLRVDTHGVVEADPETFGVVQRIFEEYARDLRGTKAIAQRLQADGLPTPGTAPWSAPAVARVLRSRTLIGELPFRDSWVEGAHAPLLDLDLFEKAQALADSRSTQRSAARAQGRLHPEQRHHLRTLRRRVQRHDRDQRQRHQGPVLHLHQGPPLRQAELRRPLAAGRRARDPGDRCAARHLRRPRALRRGRRRPPHAP